MSENVTISLIGACTTVVVSALNLGFSMASSKRGKRNEQHLAGLSVQTNGLQEKLLKVTGEAEFAKGVKHAESVR